jgi:uncharacterized coiled-coil DUF342 family protein
MDLETKLEVLTERVSNLSDQLKRFISHLESEQRVTGEISKRVDQLSSEIEFLQQRITEKRTEGRWKLETFITIASLISSITLGIIALTH